MFLYIQFLETIAKHPCNVAANDISRINNNSTENYSEKHNIGGILHVWPWWRHQTETFSALLAICAGNSPGTGEVPAQRPVTRNFDVFFDLRLNKRLRKQSWGWWFETLSRPLWRHLNATFITLILRKIHGSQPPCTLSRDKIHIPIQILPFPEQIVNIFTKTLFTSNSTQTPH